MRGHEMTNARPTSGFRPGRALRLLMALATLVGALVAVSASPAAAMLPPNEGGCSYPSSIGGSISRAEVMCRAFYWYKIRSNPDLTYDDPGDTNYLPYHQDPTNSKTYRRDCSGYVSMAWHLSSSLSTSTLRDVANPVPGGWSGLLAGDILDYPGQHAVIFVGWRDANKTSFYYYAFGHTPVAYNWTTTSGGGGDPAEYVNPAGKIDNHGYGGYLPYRYKKITG